NNIVSIGRYIIADSFWTAQVSQIDITPRSEFEMIPVIGDHTVTLGNADELDTKFKHLYAFYKQAWLQNGMNTYEKLDVQYTNEVGHTQKGAAKAQAVSTKIKQVMEILKHYGSVDTTGSLLSPPAKPTSSNLAGDSLKKKKPVVVSPKTKPKIPPVKSVTPA